MTKKSRKKKVKVDSEKKIEKKMGNAALVPLHEVEEKRRWYDE